MKRKALNVDAVMRAYLRECLRRDYDEPTVGRELVAVRDAVDQVNNGHED